MWSLTFVLLSVVYSATAITLPNGFTFDESQYINLESRGTSLLDQKCDGKYAVCVDDCETIMKCDGNNNVIDSRPCSTSRTPYCVKGFGSNSYCTGNFPMHNPTCLNKALNSFMCTADGNFPDPTDCTKYQFACHYNHEHIACSCFQVVDCDGNPNTFTFLGRDIIHYAYCLVIGSINKVLMFKCPTGTVHNLTLSNVTNSVDCLPVQPAVS